MAGVLVDAWQRFKTLDAGSAGHEAVRRLLDSHWPMSSAVLSAMQNRLRAAHLRGTTLLATIIEALRSVLQRLRRFMFFRLLFRAINRLAKFLSWGLSLRLVLKVAIRHALLGICLWWSYLAGRVLYKRAKQAVQHTVDRVACALGSEFHLKRRELRKELREADSFDSWQKAARKLDKLEGLTAWKMNPESPLCDHRRIARNLNILRELVANKKVEEITFLLRSILSRNLAGIDSNALYTHMRVGTKKLIEDFQSEVVKALELVRLHPDLPQANKLAFFKETRHAYGRTALLLSGGATLGLFHIGVIKALHENNLLPQIISGSSVGSIFAALIATRSDEQIAQLGLPGSIELAFFPRHSTTLDSMKRKFRRFLTEGVFMDINILAQCVRSNIGDVTFLEAHERYRRIANITVSDARNQHKPLLLNFLTAPNVLIWSAAVASCAIPGVYAPFRLLAKNKHGEIVTWPDDEVRFMDGSVQLDLPMEQLRELFNVQHFIVSQCNPHVVPFIFRAQSNKEASPVVRLIHALRQELHAVARGVVTVLGGHRLTFLSVNKWVEFFEALASQNYQGDITLVPNVELRDYSLLLANPTTERMVACREKSRRYTWTRIGLVAGHCEIEFALDRMFRQLRGESIFEESTRKTRMAKRMRAALSKQLHTRAPLSTRSPLRSLALQPAASPLGRSRSELGMNIAMVSSSAGSLSDSKAPLYHAGVARPDEPSALSLPSSALTLPFHSTASSSSSLSESSAKALQQRKKMSSSHSVSALAALSASSSSLSFTELGPLSPATGDELAGNDNAIGSCMHMCGKKRANGGHHLQQQVADECDCNCEAPDSGGREQSKRSSSAGKSVAKSSKFNGLLNSRVRSFCILSDN